MKRRDLISFCARKASIGTALAGADGLLPAVFGAETRCEAAADTVSAADTSAVSSAFGMERFTAAAADAASPAETGGCASDEPELSL